MAWLNGARFSLTTRSKYTAGSSASKIQYVLTQRAMSPNDLHMVGLGWPASKPSLWETNGKSGRDRESRTYLFLWKVRLFYWETLGFFRLEKQKPCQFSYRNKKFLRGQYSLSAFNETGVNVCEEFFYFICNSLQCNNVNFSDLNLHLVCIFVSAAFNNLQGLF